MNLKLAVLVVIAGLGLIILSVVGFLVYKFYTYRTDTTLATDILITTQWREIDVKDLLPPLSQDTNSIYIAAPETFEAFNVDRGIVAPDGTVIDPEVEVIDTAGKSHFFKQEGARRGNRYEMAKFEPYPGLQKGIQIERIRVRANHEFRSPIILWSSYDAKDLP